MNPGPDYVLLSLRRRQYGINFRKRIQKPFRDASDALAKSPNTPLDGSGSYRRDRKCRDSLAAPLRHGSQITISSCNQSDKWSVTTAERRYSINARGQNLLLLEIPAEGWRVRLETRPVTTLISRTRSPPARLQPMINNPPPDDPSIPPPRKYRHREPLSASINYTGISLSAIDDLYEEHASIVHAGLAERGRMDRMFSRNEAKEI